jgi:1-acyl-sn-glycerol-3-phosphate acyltransferase
LAVLRAGGLLALSPEGTRSQTGALARGRTGVAYLAMLAGVPVVPIALWGQERMPARWRSMRRAPVMVRIGAPLRFSHREPDAGRLRECADHVMRSIAEMLPAEYRGVYADR